MFAASLVWYRAGGRGHRQDRPAQPRPALPGHRLVGAAARGAHRLGRAGDRGHRLVLHGRMPAQHTRARPDRPAGRRPEPGNPPRYPGTPRSRPPLSTPALPAAGQRPRLRSPRRSVAETGAVFAVPGAITAALHNPIPVSLREWLGLRGGLSRHDLYLRCRADDLGRKDSAMNFRRTRGRIRWKD